MTFAALVAYRNAMRNVEDAIDILVSLGIPTKEYASITAHTPTVVLVTTAREYDRAMSLR